MFPSSGCGEREPCLVRFLNCMYAVMKVHRIALRTSRPVVTLGGCAIFGEPLLDHLVVDHLTRGIPEPNQLSIDSGPEESQHDGPAVERAYLASATHTLLFPLHPLVPL